MTGLQRVGATLGAALATSAMRRMLLGYLAFATTEWAAWVAILLHAYHEGGTTAVGLVAVAQLVPAIFVAPLGSTLSERMDRQAALVMAYTVLGVCMAALWLTLALDAPIWAFYLVAVVANCAVTLCRPAHYAAIPRLAESPEELVAANSASSTMENLGVFVGPALIAALIPWSGLSSVFLVLFGLELVAALSIAMVKAGATTAAARELRDEEAVRGFVHDSLGGFREVRATRGAGMLLLLVGVQFVIVGMLDVLGVVFPQEVLGTGEAGASVLIAASGIGGLIGAGTTVLLVGRRRMSPAFIAGFVGSGASLALVSVSQLLAMAALLVAGSGFSRAFIDVSGRTLLQRTVREDVLARVFGLQESVLMAGLAVGSVIAPVAVELVGARGAFVVAGLLPAVLAVVAWPSLRKLDREAVLPGPEFALLQGLSLFAPLPQARLELLSHIAEPRDLPAGRTVIRQGEQGDRFYVIAEGEVSVSRDGREVSRLAGGGHFGEVALLRDAPRNATVTTTAPTRLLVIDREDFLSAVTGSTLSHDEAERVVRQRESFPDDEA